MKTTKVVLRKFLYGVKTLDSLIASYSITQRPVQSVFLQALPGSFSLSVVVRVGAFKILGSL
jgi:hypothetical protein